MKVREVVQEDRSAWVRMRGALWPEAADHDVDTHRYFNEPNHRKRTFVAEDEARKLVGFLELDQRKYAPGCDSSPVPYIEGWYVEPSARHRGIGRALIDSAERWARAAGFHEIASDADLDNEDGIAAHAALGYEEVERIVCFRRSL